MMSIATAQPKTENCDSEHFPLNFNSLLSKLKTIEDKDAIEESLDKLKTMPTKENARTITKMYENLIDINKIKELNLERESFYHTYKRKLNEFKFNVQRKDRKMKSFMFKSMGTSPMDSINDINADLIKKRSMEECKQIRSCARKLGREEARNITTAISSFRSPVTSGDNAKILRSYYTTPRKVVMRSKYQVLQKSNSKYEKSSSDNFNNVPVFNLKTLPCTSCSPQLSKRSLNDNGKTPFKKNMKSWFARILQNDS